MQTLISNKDTIFEIKNKVDQLDSSLFIHYNYPNIPIYNDTISIIMTSSNRSRQVNYTLQTIEKCLFKHVHVIIVDDSDIDPIKKECINGYAFHIDLIYIRTENKNWINPVVNYNIGFKFIKGSGVIIQNAEVCYIGDILSWVSMNITDNNYYSFDIRAINSFENNEVIYNTANLTTEIYSKNIYHTWEEGWYQGRKKVSNYHFLIAITRNTFELIKNFSYDYTFGINFDDNDFLLKIKSKNIKIVNLFHDEYFFGGIHLYHTSSYLKWKNIESNLEIFNKKVEYYNLNKMYIDFIENTTLVCKKFHISQKTDLLELQEQILKSNNKNIHLIFDKSKFTKEMNSFRKCILKKHFYKNSEIKLPNNIIIKISFDNII
jgi:hypothetical protein